MVKVNNNIAEIFMLLIKVSLAGLAGVSLCMASISGIVTDTGSTPISGAVVQLENGGQSATTGDDGRFTLTATAILPVKSKLLPNSLSARIAGNLMIVTIAERSAVEVAVFDLKGNSLATVRKTLGAGSHSLSLPFRGTGIYLYKVKSGNRELVLKGNAVGGILYRSSITSQGSPSNSMAKQAKAAVEIDDIIAVTKAGYLNYHVVVYNADTSGIIIQMIPCEEPLIDVNENVYQTVKIGNQVWMAENLRVTKYNDGSAIPLDASTETWYNASTPKYCYYNNMANTDSIKKFGALYNWYAVNPANPNKIAPKGWHVPSDSEWMVLAIYLVFNGYNWDGTRDTAQGYDIAKSMAAKTDWWSFRNEGTVGCDLTKNNITGFSALPGGVRDNDNIFYARGAHGHWWSITQSENNAEMAFSRALYHFADFFSSDIDDKNKGFSVRLLRD